MKKLFFIFVLALLSSVMFAQKKSNYEKYWQAREDSINKSTASITTAKPEYDDLYYQPSKDAKKIKKHKRADVDVIVDTLVSENPDIQVNYYYNYDPYYYSYNIGRFYHGGFNYWMYGNSFYYSNWMYDPYDFYWDMRFSGYPYWSYNSFYQGFYGYNYWSPWRNYNHYRFNNYNHNNYNNYYTHNWNNSGRNNSMNPVHYRTQTSSVQNRRPVVDNQRTYRPSYNQPRMNTRPQYNNSRANTSTNNRRADVSTQPRTYSQPIRSESRTQTRTYTAPTRSYSESRSNNNGGSDRRSSGSYGGGSSYSAPRSSGSSNFSSGSRSSGGSSSSGSSSSGSSSGGRSSGGGRR